MESHIYTPEIESYAFDDTVLWKIEKVLVKVLEDDVKIFYICIDKEGFRTVLDNCSDDVDSFVMDSASGTIEEDALRSVLSFFMEDAKEEIIGQIVDYGVKTVNMSDGSKLPIEEY